MEFGIPAMEPQSTLIGLSVALGIGLLIGAERERRKGQAPRQNAAGIRTFAVAALLGAVGYLTGGLLLLALAVLLVGIGAFLTYQRTNEIDPGITTEFALLLTSLLGGLAVRDALLAAGVGSVLALLLASRGRIHHFVRSVLAERELYDIMLFCATALIVLPVAPDRYMGPFDAINPHALARLIVIVMAISAVGYVAMRWMGPRYGLPLSGFASGFVSSTATLYAMGQRASRTPGVLGAAVAGATLSSVATIVQLATILALVQPDLLRLMALPLGLGGLAVSAYGLFFLVRSARQPVEQETTDPGRAVDLKTSIAFALLLGIVLLASAGLNATLGHTGIWLGAAVSGLADAHAAAASAASLAASGNITVEQAVLPVLLALTTNTLTKCGVAFHAGGAAYARQIIPGLVCMVAAVWAGVWLSSGAV